MNKPKKLSPLQLEFLLHCFYCPAPYTENEKFDNHYKIEETATQFMNDGILIPGETPNTYDVTEKGHVWISRILSTPYPKQTWGYNYENA